MVNETRKDFNPGDQLFMSYGNRSNQFLLQHYGFVFEDNGYDSYSFNVRMDLKTDQKLQAADFFAPSDQGEDLQVIRLKKH